MPNSVPSLKNNCTVHTEARVYCNTQQKAGTRLSRVCTWLSPLLPSVPEKLMQKLEFSVADSKNWRSCYLKSAPVSVFCLVLLQKSRHSAHPQRFKPIVANSQKLLRGFQPSVHTSDPAVEHFSKTPWLEFCFGEAKYALPNALKGKGWSLPVQPKGSPYHGLLCGLYPLGSFLLFPSFRHCSTKWVPSPSQPCGFPLLQFMAPSLASAPFSHSSCADYFLNSQIIFLFVQNSWMLL